jgi:hypothetical protein
MIRQPALIDSIGTFPGVELRVELRPFRGQLYCHVKRWQQQADGAWIAGAGIAVGVRHLPQLRKALDVAENAARETGALR